MRAAQITELGTPPVVAEVEPPEPAEGRTVLQVTAVALNPVDLTVAAGRFYGGHPELPYVPGNEAVGRLAGGTRVYVSGRGLGLARDGTLTECVDVTDAHVCPIPEGFDDATAVAAGIAGIAGWLPVAWRSPVQEGDRVLVLGATGTAGSVAVQGARLLGAERVVAAGRNPDRLRRAEKLGADATISLGGGDLADEVEAAFDGEGPTLIVDLLWGGPLEAALAAAAPGARVVHIGQSAGPEATLRSADVRGKQLVILGYSNFALSQETKCAGYRQLLEHVEAGEVTIEHEMFAFDRVADAWAAQAEGQKAVVVFGKTAR
ncbi:MAG TPA: zinc-binding alcohol dehydrogenase family protein [Gaiellaceae bacterium]